MFKRKLTALQYEATDNFEITDQSQFRSLISWLEDRKIRHYKIEDRCNLRNTESSGWPAAFEKYMSDVACPMSPKAPHKDLLEWLLNHAVRLEYNDNAEMYNSMVEENVKKLKESGQPECIHVNPLDLLDFESDEFRDGVNGMADILQITRHPDHKVTLLACEVAIKELAEKKLQLEQQQQEREREARRNRRGRGESTPQLLPLEEMNMGQESSTNPIMDKAIKILRFLHIEDLRTLQTTINECIVAVQQVTADPKTDTSIGKVGF